MDFVRTPGFLKIAFREITWHIRDTEPSLYLTFDDGPTPGITARVLEVLSQFRAYTVLLTISQFEVLDESVYTIPAIAAFENAAVPEFVK